MLVAIQATHTPLGRLMTQKELTDAVTTSTNIGRDRRGYAAVPAECGSRV